jgi:VIT family
LRSASFAATRAASCASSPGVYEQRGLPPALASEVAQTMSRRDEVEVRARDELGLDAERVARPFQAAWTSALWFSAGPLVPLLTVEAAPARARAGAVVVVTLLALALLGDVGAPLGGARAAVRRSGSSPGAPSRWRAPPASGARSGDIQASGARTAVGGQSARADVDGRAGSEAR